MSIKQDYIHEMCAGFTSFVEGLPYNLTIKYIFHRRGQKNDAVELESSFFQSHPAGSIALNILRKSKTSQNSNFHGLAIETTQYLMGLKEQKNALGVITINLDNYTKTEDVLHEAYHLGWMAIDTARLLQHPKYKNNLKSGPLIPKRSAINLAKACLQADIFSALILAHQGFDSMIKTIAEKRCMDSMLPQINSQPWNFAYPLAYETTTHAWKELIDTKSNKYHFISTPLEYAGSIAATIPDDSYQQWWDFCKPSQTMAWHDDTPEYILSAAIHTSDNPIIKVTANLVQDCVNLKTSKEIIQNNHFNAFIPPYQSEAYHEQAIEETFELILEKGLETRSAQPFIDTANRQNQQLTEGKIMGWCASALQTAARTFETTAIEDKEEKRNLIKLGFEGSQKEVQYDSLLSLGEDIIERRKKGEIVTMEDIEELARLQTKSDFISTSVKQTIKDPGYQKQLEQTQDMNNVYIPKVKQSAPTTQPKNENNATPKAAPNIASGMGGSMMSNNGTIQQHVTTEDDTKKAE